MARSYLHSALAPATQVEQAHPSQVKNSAGGYAFQISDWDRLRRFLILGAEGGTYYASERKLTRENAACVERLIKEDGPRLVREVADLSESGRAPKNDPAILALALAARLGDPVTKAAAYAGLPRVCRTGTHLYHFVAFADSLGGWGRGLRNAVARWFSQREVGGLAYQLIKYQQRDGWAARDLLRLSHAKPPTLAHDALFAWATSGFDGVASAGKLAELPPMMHALEELKTTKDLGRACKLIGDYKLPREVVPTQLLKRPEIWDALLPHMGLTAVVRNLATMTRVGLLAPMAERVPLVCSKITDEAALKKARVHPIQLLSALRTYERGRSLLGSHTWTPVQQVVDALDEGFYRAFASVEPTGKATVIALDVSGSMATGEVAGCPGLSPREASAAMAMVTAATEPRHYVCGFSEGLSPLPISPKMRLGDVMRVISDLPFQRTDCALPFLAATETVKRGGPKAEAFVVYTDNETYHGYKHPHVALEEYRRLSGVPARSAVVAFTGTPFSIANPEDPGMMDFVGFDASAPALLADFFRG